MSSINVSCLPLLKIMLEYYYFFYTTPTIPALTPSTSDLPSNEPPAPIIDVPYDTAPTVDLAGPSDSHALRRSHRVTTLPSHLRDFHCFSALAYLQEPQSFCEASSNPL